MNGYQRVVCFSVGVAALLAGCDARSLTGPEGGDTYSPIRFQPKAWGPTELLSGEGESRRATVPRRIVIAQDASLDIEFEDLPVREPVTADQLPSEVEVWSRFPDGTLHPGAFSRNPTNEAIAHLWSPMVQSMTFWPGWGYDVHIIGNGPPGVCGTGRPRNWKPERRFPAGYVDPTPISNTSSAPLDLSVGKPILRTLAWNAFTNATSHRAYMSSSEQVMWNVGDLPADASSYTVQAGVLSPGKTYFLCVSGVNWRGFASIEMRFSTAHDARAGVIEVLRVESPTK